jgi:hypothetical protein
MMENFNSFNVRLGMFKFPPSTLKDVNTVLYPNDFGQYQKNATPNWVYHGEGVISHGFHNGTGRGVKVYVEGTIEIGYFENWSAKGYTRVLSLVDPLCYEGDMNKGQKHGKGVEYYGNRKRFEGHWEKNMREGQGYFCNEDRLYQKSVWNKGIEVYTQKGNKL